MGVINRAPTCSWPEWSVRGPRPLFRRFMPWPRLVSRGSYLPPQRIGAAAPRITMGPPIEPGRVTACNDHEKMLERSRDWNAVAVMDALTGHCFVQTFQSPSDAVTTDHKNLPKLAIMGQDTTGVQLGGLYWPETKQAKAFEYNLVMQNPLELQRELCDESDESRLAILKIRSSNNPSSSELLRGVKLRSALTDMQIAHKQMAVWPICLPPLVSNVRVPLMLESLEQVLASGALETRGDARNKVRAYIVCDGIVHTLLNRRMQTSKLPRPVSVHTMMASHPFSIRIFAPAQLKSFLASAL